MSKLLRYGVGAVFIAALVAFWWWTHTKTDLSDLTTTAVSRGSVAEIVSVSSFVEADNTAKLGFPAPGRISEIFVKEGQIITAGELLATVGQSNIAAQRKAAQANLTSAVAERDELVAGQTTEERAVTESTVAKAKAAWEQTVATELQKIKNAEIALRSNDLIAYTEDPGEDAPAPNITGSYTCNEEGSYIIEFYRSGTDAGYSFKYSGLEEGRSAASVDQPVPFGSCGLSLEISAGYLYNSSVWKISVPNTRSNTYYAYANARDLAMQQATENIQAAKDTLELAENTALRDTAAPRIEALIAANARVNAAQAELARIDALLSDLSVQAPFAGTITDIDKLPGEVATTEPFITLLAVDAFTLTARIPEIDIRKIEPGQKTTVVFDASTNETLTGIVEYVSPLAVEIDGVAYFEAKVKLSQAPDWLRSGLNADVDIVINEHEDVTRLPKRFVEMTELGPFVTVLNNDKLERIPVEVGLVGNDGYIEVTSLNTGTTVVAP